MVRAGFIRLLPGQPGDTWQSRHSQEQGLTVAASPARLSPRGDGPEVVRGIAKQDLSNLHSGTQVRSR